MKLFSIFLGVTFSASLTFAQGLGTQAPDQGSAPTQGANQTAGSEKGTDIAIGAVSLAGGATMMGLFCPTTAVPGHLAYCIIGGGLVAASIPAFIKAGERDNNIAQTDGTGSTSGTSGGPGTTPPTDPTNPGGPGTTTTSVPPDLQPYLDQAQAALPPGQTLASLAGQGDGGGVGGAAADLPPDAQDAVNKAIANLPAKYRVSSVGTEGGGGGGAHKGGVDSGPSIGDLIANMNNTRNSASVDGLSKRLGSDAIGVAGDNIFKQVSRRYQTKKFLNIPPMKGYYSSKERL